MKNWKRAHSVGAGAQLTDMIGFAIGQLAVERAHHRHRKKLEEAA